MLNNVFFCFYACDDNSDLSKDETLCDYVMFNSGHYSTVWDHCASSVYHSAKQKSEFVMLLSKIFNPKKGGYKEMCSIKTTY